MSVGISTHNLTKFYGKNKTAALDKLSLNINPGEVYGYLGSNGAGKSTTIRLLLNFLQPSAGAATILGLDSVKDTVAIKKRTGYLAGDVALYTKPTGRAILDYLAHFQNVGNYRRTLEKRFQADLDKPVGQLSKGNRQKIGIIQAFMHQPEVLILDEPTSGLDPLMQEAFYETIREARDRGAAILMSSHNINEAERVCDRVGIIKHGKLIQQQPIDVKNSLGGTQFQVRFKKAAELDHCKQIKQLALVSQANATTAVFRPTGTIAAALTALGQFEIQTITTQTLDLEDEFLSYYGADS